MELPAYLALEVRQRPLLSLEVAHMGLASEPEQVVAEPDSLLRGVDSLVEMVDIAGRFGDSGFVQLPPTAVGPGVIAGTLVEVVAVEEHIGGR